MNLHSLRTRLLGLGLIFLLMVLGQAALTAWTTQQSLELSQGLAGRTLTKLNLAHDAKLAVVQVQQFLSDISATRGQNGLDDGLDIAKQQAAQFREDLNKLKQIDPEHVSEYEALAEAFEPYYSIGKKMAHAYVSGGPAAGNAMMPQFDKAAGALGEKLDTFVKGAVATANDDASQLTQDEYTGRKWAIITSVVLILGLIVMIAINFRGISQLPALTEAMEQIAGGDLSGQPLPVKGRDEVSQLADATNRMRRELHGLVGGILKAADALVDSVSRLSAGLGQASTRLDEQTRETEQVASAMEELQSSVADVAGHTSSAAEAANQADASVASGRQILEPLLADVESLASDMTQNASMMEEVEKESGEIGGILLVIQGVAEQTNLLALNAAIEAARAGEAGRGFAVVADEVRGLAGKVQSASHDIQRMIESLQSRIKSAVTAMEEGRVTSARSADGATSAQRQFDAIREAVASLTDMNTQVASTTEEQSAVAEDMSRRLQQISQASGEAVAGVGESSRAGESLLGEAGRLKEMVARFSV